MAKIDIFLCLRIKKKKLYNNWVSIRLALSWWFIKNPPTMQDMQVQFLGREDPLEKGTATHSSILGLENPMD